MSVYSQIEDAKKELEAMKYGLQFYKDEARKEVQIKRINTLIKLVNLVERLAAVSVDRDYIDVFLLMWFEREYLKEQNDGREGFVSIQTLNMLRSQIADSVKLGSQNVLDQLATQMAIDTLSHANTIDEQAKKGSVTKDELLLRYLGECKKHWVSQLESFLNHVHDKKLVWS